MTERIPYVDANRVIIQGTGKVLGWSRRGSVQFVFEVDRDLKRGLGYVSGPDKLIASMRHKDMLRLPLPGGVYCDVLVRIVGKECAVLKGVGFERDPHPPGWAPYPS